MPNYDYYTDLRVVVSNEDWSKVSLQRVEELYAIAKDDIRANKKAQQKSNFENDSEYRIYLIALVEYAGLLSAGIEEFDSVVE